MTWTVDDATRDDVRTSQSVRTGRLRRALLGALVGALLLGGAGAVYASVRDSPVSASALVLTSPDPAAVENPGSRTVSGDPAARNATYIETELVYLAGVDLANQVARELGGRTPDLVAARIGDSNVISIRATAPNGPAAVRQAQTAADRYLKDRQQRLTERIADQTAAVEAQLTETADALATLGAPQTTGFDPTTQQREALSQQYLSQLDIRDTLQREVARVPQVATQVQGASVLPDGVISSAVLTVMGAATLGALLGAVVPLLVGSLGGRIRDEQDVADLGAALLSPVLPTRRAGRKRTSEELGRAVQLQALRMPFGPVTGGSLALLAATSGVGTSFTAVQHARHAARRGRTLLVCAAGGDSDALDELGLDPDHAGLVDLVPAKGRSITADALSLAAQSSTVPDLSVLTPGAGHGDDLVGMERAIASGLVSAAATAGWAVVVDTGPLDRSGVGLQAARQCDEAVIVAAVGRSTTDEIDQTLQVLRSAGISLTGIIVNRPPRRHSRDRGSTSVRVRSLLFRRKQVQRA